MKKRFLFIIFVFIFLPFNVFAYNKTETVYANLDSYGSIVKTKVNTKLSDIDKGDITDNSRLEKIKNLNGNEKFSRDSEKITWKSTGREIYYQGIINDNLPINVNVKYYLNDKEISPDKLKNKKGNIRIELSFINNDYNAKYGMYVPYVIDMSMSLNNKYDSNYGITNGIFKTIDDNTLISAIASPGLYDSTGIEEFKSLDKIVLSYTTTKYKSNDIYMIITPKVLSKIDIDRLNNATSKLNQINKLQDGVNQLEDGSYALTNGSSEILNGLIKLNNGLESALDGSKDLVNGLDLINSNMNSLSSISDLVDRLYETYNSNITMLQGIESGQTAQQLQNGINNATNEKNSLEESLILVNSNIAQLEVLENSSNITEEQLLQLNTLRSQKTQLEAGIHEYQQGINEALDNLSKLPVAPYKIAGANEVISQVLCGILNVPSMEYVNNETINIFKENINKLVGGVNTIYNGSSKLSNGIFELYNGSNQLVEGNIKLNNGINSLSDGINKLNDEGISKLMNLTNNIGRYGSKINSLVSMSKNYSGYGSNNSDNTIFIYKLAINK